MLLVKHASGDEEITATGIDVKGVLLCQSLPHLSHLGVHPGLQALDPCSGSEPCVHTPHDLACHIKISEEQSCLCQA